MDRDDWIIGLHNSEANDMIMYRFYGTVEEAKNKILALIEEDRENDPENWERGTEAASDIQESSHYQLCGYGQYKDYEISYTAIKLVYIDHLER